MIKSPLSCDTDESKKFSGEPPWVIVWEEADHGNLRGRTLNFRGSASSQHYNSGGGGFTGKIFDSSVSHLSALATHRPIWGRVGQGAFELILPQISKCHFWEWPLRVGYIY